MDAISTVLILKRKEKCNNRLYVLTIVCCVCYNTNAHTKISIITISACKSWRCKTIKGKVFTDLGRCVAMDISSHFQFAKRHYTWIILTKSIANAYVIAFAKQLWLIISDSCINSIARITLSLRRFKAISI